MHSKILAAFRHAVEERDASSVIATLAPDITFNGPVTFQPFESLTIVRAAILPVLTVWQDLTYVDELPGHDTVGLIFEARVGTVSAQGIDILRFNDAGLINHITVMVRPLSALQALADAMSYFTSPTRPASRGPS